jgi:hypothetical protein
MLRFKRRVKGWLMEYEQVNVFMPHALYYPSNYLLFADLAVRRYLLPDGVLNYYNYRVGPLRRPSMLLRWAMGSLAGLPYVSYRGHLTAIDSGRYEGVYTFSERNLVTCHENTVVLEVPGIAPEDYQPNPGVCLFLDHSLDAVPYDLREQMLASARQYLANCGAATIWYKAHPSANSGESIKLVPGCRVLDSSAPAELLVTELQPAEVVSFLSSALPAIADNYPQCRCTAVGLELLKNLPHFAEIHEHFLLKGVTMAENLHRLPLET